jgi:hypothetical protein
MTTHTRYRFIGVAMVLAYLLVALFAILLAALLLFLLTYMVEAVDMRLPDLREEIAQCGHVECTMPAWLVMSI